VWHTARAQTYPTRPITMIVPFPPGGANDMLERIIAERMRGILSQSIVVENIGAPRAALGWARSSIARGRLAIVADASKQGRKTCHLGSDKSIEVFQACVLGLIPCARTFAASSGSLLIREIAS
jgi:hypothetical protein